MGYIPPYIPDTYLLHIRQISNDSHAIKKVEEVSSKNIDVHHQNKPFYPKPYKTHDGKGNLFDQYV